MSRAALHAIAQASQLLTAPDCREVYALLGMMRHPSARAFARDRGSGLFGPGPVRAVASAIVHEREFAPSIRAGNTVVLIDKLAQCAAGIIDPDEAWTLSLLRMLAETRYRELLAAQLDWAAGAIRGGQTPLAFARRTVDRAFAIAAGDIPMDTMEAWEDVA